MALNSKQIVIRRTTLTRARPPSNYKKNSVPLQNNSWNLLLVNAKHGFVVFLFGRDSKRR